MALSVVYIGNFEPPYSTENDLLDTFRRMGVDVQPVQEQDEGRWQALTGQILSSEPPDAIFWTRTASLSAQVDVRERRRMQIQARLADVPTIGVHLDRWWGLTRQEDLYNDPFFRCEYLFTADGHDPARWEALGANHFWMPPAIAPRWCFDGTPQARFEAEIVFVGGWKGYGHTDWTHRPQLVEFLKRNYAGRVRFFPEEGQPAVRGEELNDLYASCKLAIGDSCLVPDPVTGEPWTHYCSDRVFETIGRGAFLLHPYVPGVVGPQESDEFALLRNMRHLGAWDLGDWAGLDVLLDWWLDDAADLDLTRKMSTEYVRSWHTYENRLRDILDGIGLEP